MGGFAPCESRPSLLWGGGELTARRGRSGAWMGSAQSRGRGFPLHWVRPPANSAECAAAMHRWGGVKPPLRRAGQNGSTQGDALGFVSPHRPVFCTGAVGPHAKRKQQTLPCPLLGITKASR
jgi:hypothetical protein